MLNGLAINRGLDEQTVLRINGVTVMRITVIGIDRNRAKLLFSGPREVEVQREEIDRTRYPQDYQT